MEKLDKRKDYSCHDCKFFLREWIPRTGCDACRIPDNTNKPTMFIPIELTAKRRTL